MKETISTLDLLKEDLRTRAPRVSVDNLVPICQKHATHEQKNICSWVKGKLLFLKCQKNISSIFNYVAQSQLQCELNMFVSILLLPCVHIKPQTEHQTTKVATGRALTSSDWGWETDIISDRYYYISASKWRKKCRWQATHRENTVQKSDERRKLLAWNKKNLDDFCRCHQVLWFSPKL